MRKATGALALLSAAGIALACVVAPGTAQAADTTQMLRLYNQYTGEHLFTAKQEEYDYLGSIGWTQENDAWLAPASGDEVYRLYNPYSGDHHYTKDAKEYEKLGSIGWKKEGVAWHSDTAKSVPIYRLYNPYVQFATHHYTASWEEVTSLEELGWEYEGEAWYGLKDDEPAKPAETINGKK